MAIITFEQVTAGMQRCMAAHPPVDQCLSQQSQALVNLYAEMFAVKARVVETQELDPAVVDDLKLWGVIQ